MLDAWAVAQKKDQNFEVTTEPQSTIELGRPWWAVLDYKVYKDLRKPRCIDCYLHRLVVYHFYKPIDNNKNRIVPGDLPTMSKY